MEKRKILVFIVAYFAETTIENVLDRIPKNIKKISEIAIFDDASKDKTYKISLDYKKRNKMDNLKVFHHKKNLGYGGNQKTAYNYAIKNGFEIAIMLHGDAQYPPEKIPEIIKQFQNPKVGMVSGSRILGNPIRGGMPIWKYLGNRILSTIENIALQLSVSEYHSGFRAYRCSTLAKMPFNICSNDFHFDTDIIIQLKIAKAKIGEIAIPTYYGDEECRVNSFAYGMYILKSLCEYYLQKLGLKKTKKFQKMSN